MEKSPSSRYEPQTIPRPADGTTTSIKRKPVAIPAAAYTQSREINVEPKHDYGRQDTTTTIDSLPQRHDARVRSNRHTQHASRSPSPLARLRTRWSYLSKRSRIILVTALLLLLALIIGLAAGLSRKSRISHLPLPTNHGGPYTGDLTYYDPALGACGLTSSSADAIVAVSHLLFDAVSTSSNPNANPLCNKKIRARRDGKSIDLTVVDRCTGCQAKDIDTTRSVFKQLADIDDGRVVISWSWLEDVPGEAANG